MLLEVDSKKVDSLIQFEYLLDRRVEGKIIIGRLRHGQYGQVEVLV